MRVVAVIPARMASTRLPGKPLADLVGRPMIEHVHRRVQLCDAVDEVLVATCDDEIREAAGSFGARVVMTGAHHERASERMAEVATKVVADLYVLVQGDEPMIHPDMVTEAIEPFHTDEELECVNLMHRIDTEDEFRDPNTIKVVVGPRSNALFMSRQPVPTQPDGWGSAPAFRQVCVIPFRARTLAEYARMAPTPLEQAESIDMLRLLENGRPVRMVETPFATHAVDTEQDRVRVEQRLLEDPMLERYT